MVRTMGTLKKAPVKDWSTSTQTIRFSYDCRGQELWERKATAGSTRAISHGVTMLPGPGSSPFENALQQLPTDLRIKLVDGLTEGGDAGSGKQATLAAARLCCKTLRSVVDDGMQSLRLNVLPDVAQGPAPSLSDFPNVRSLTLSIDTAWKAPRPDDSSQDLLPGERPEPSLELRSWKYLYPPSLLLEPLQGQPIQSLHRLRSLTLIGQLTCFRSLCEQLTAVFAAGAATPDPGNAGPSAGTGVSRNACPGGAAASDSSEDGTSGEESGSSDEHASDDGSGATERSDTIISDAAAADPYVAATGCSGGAGAGGGFGGAAACSLEHLNLGNARFQRRRVDAGVVAEGHRALAALGLRELTLGAELLPGLEAHAVHGQQLQKLHVYRDLCLYNQPIGAAALASLRRTPLVHVGLLGRAWWDALGALPDTLASVYTITRDCRLVLKLGQDDEGQATRELMLLPCRASCASSMVQYLSAKPRIMPPSARVTLVQLQRLRELYKDAFSRDEGFEDLFALLARAERVECRSVSVRSGEVREVLQGLRAVPRDVWLLVPLADKYSQKVPLRFDVAAATAGAGRSSGGLGAGGDQSAPAAAAAGAGAGPGGSSGWAGTGGVQRGATAAAAELPTAEELLSQALGLMEARARAGEPPQGQQEQQRAQGPAASARRDGWGYADCVGEEEGETVTEWWLGGKAASGSGAAGGGGGAGVVLLSGPGVSALIEHDRGMAVLDYVFAGLSLSRGSKRRRRAYQVLPGGGGVLLQWDDGDVGEAAAEAVLAGAQELGLEVPEGGVRAVALPHRDLDSACKGLDAGIRQVLQSRTLSAENLAGQLEAVAELWGEVRKQWRKKWFAAKSVPTTMPWKPSAQPEEDAGMRTRAQRAAATPAAVEAEAEAAQAEDSMPRDTAAQGGSRRGSRGGRGAAAGPSGESGGGGGRGAGRGRGAKGAGGQAAATQVGQGVQAQARPATGQRAAAKRAASPGPGASGQEVPAKKQARRRGK